ncbi:hypothetical protein Pcinc_043946 [Petrolisthes cinctipes]|uniref:Uncharacterized protein n=1 Tax=Petrolisthes cinctipes TaxID=88211 RepID=A0AAE1BGS2_PETCI|nr:hypothetical protein Pcinc_043946 [Petrolisthes cinctipes]
MTPVDPTHKDLKHSATTVSQCNHKTTVPPQKLQCHHKPTVPPQNKSQSHHKNYSATTKQTTVPTQKHSAISYCTVAIVPPAAAATTTTTTTPSSGGGGGGAAPPPLIHFTPAPQLTPSLHPSTPSPSFTSPQNHTPLSSTSPQHPIPLLHFTPAPQPTPSPHNTPTPHTHPQPVKTNMVVPGLSTGARFPSLCGAKESGRCGHTIPALG